MLTIWKKLKKAKSLLFKKGGILAKNSLKVDFLPPKLNRELIFYAIVIKTYLILTKIRNHLEDFGRHILI
jgi:hypothetical protein